MASILLNSVLNDIFVLISAPFQNPSLIWQLAPIFLIWLIMVFYFGTHKKEELGWNTALGNGISLFWIIISAMQHIFSDSSTQFTYTKFFLIIVIAIYSLFIILTSFKHTFSDKLTYALSSPTPVYFFSALVLMYAHNLFELSISMLIAIIALFIILLIVIWLIELLLPEMKEDEDDSSFGSDDSFGDVGGDSKKDSGMDDFKFDEPTPDPAIGGIDSPTSPETPSNVGNNSNTSNLYSGNNNANNFVPSNNSYNRPSGNPYNNNSRPNNSLNNR